MRKKLFESLPEKVLVRGHWEAKLIELDGEILRENLSQAIFKHSEELNWGYAGSGPSQCSLSVLMFYLPVVEAMNLYMDFKFLVVASWPQSNFELEINLKEEIRKILEKNSVSLV